MKTSSSPSRSTTTASRFWPRSAFETAASLDGRRLASPTLRKTRAATHCLVYSAYRKGAACIGGPNLVRGDPNYIQWKERCHRTWGGAPEVEFYQAFHAARHQRAWQWQQQRVQRRGRCWQWLVVADPPLAPCSLSPAPRSHPIQSATMVSQRVDVRVACIMGLHAGLRCCACTYLPCSAGSSAL